MISVATSLNIIELTSFPCLISCTISCLISLISVLEKAELAASHSSPRSTRVAERRSGPDAYNLDKTGPGFLSKHGPRIFVEPRARACCFNRVTIGAHFFTKIIEKNAS